MIIVMEKPLFKDAPSNLSSMGRYAPTSDIFDIFDILKFQEIGINVEIYLTDAINKLALKSGVEAALLNGQRFDCISVQGYTEAFLEISSKY